MTAGGGAPGRAAEAAAMAEQLAAQRKAVQRAMVQGRRWYLRAVLMMVIAVVAAWRGGQLNYALGVVMVLLAAIALSMGRSLRRSGADSMQKIHLMEQTRARVEGKS